jgi:hypothetical protein
MENKSENSPPLPPGIEAIVALTKCAAIRKAVTRVPSNLWNMPTSELAARIAPTDVANAIRAAFWTEVAGAMVLGQAVKVSRIGQEVGLSYDHSHDLLTRDPAFLVWMLRPIFPVAGPEPLMPELLDRVGEVVRLPMTDRRGRVITRNAKLVFQAVQLLWPLCKP